MEKVIRNGKVAVLYSPNYGAGWSTSKYNKLSDPDVLLFDPEIVSLVEKHKNGEISHSNMCDKIMYYCDNKYGEGVVYYGVVGDLSIAWVPIGKEFRIKECNGYGLVNYSKWVKA